jgi:L-alanine-DL-glutamate epimerase-like enolase superfamily enzyme
MQWHYTCTKNDKKARELNMQVMIGCMNETTIGTAAIAHLLPLLDHVDMDGPLLLSEDVATGISYDNGKSVTPICRVLASFNG